MDLFFTRFVFLPASSFLSRFLLKHAPILGKHSPFLGRTGSVFGTKLLRFCEKPARFGGNWSLLGLAWGSSLTALNTKHVLVWMFVFLGLGVTFEKSQPVGSWEGKMLKPINFYVENLVLLRRLMSCTRRRAEMTSGHIECF